MQNTCSDWQYVAAFPGPLPRLPSPVEYANVGEGSVSFSTCCQSRKNGVIECGWTMAHIRDNKEPSNFYHTYLASRVKWGQLSYMQSLECVVSWTAHKMLPLTTSCLNPGQILSDNVITYILYMYHHSVKLYQMSQVTPLKVSNNVAWHSPGKTKLLLGKKIAPHTVQVMENAWWRFLSIVQLTLLIVPH